MQLLYASGFLFMGATEEQMELLSSANVTHVSYILILFSISFLLYLFVNVLLHIYAAHTWGDDESNGRRGESSSSQPGPSTRGPRGIFAHSRAASVAAPVSNYRDQPSPSLDSNGKPMNGVAGNGNVRIPPQPGHRGTASQQVRDAEEFELEGLISDAEEDGRDEEGESPNPEEKDERRQNLPMEHV